MFLLLADDAAQSCYRLRVAVGENLNLLMHMSEDYLLDCKGRGGNRIAPGKPRHCPQGKTT